ncbi:GNAT family N-acetyltransferase [Scytonema sp. NUACC26]|uniref:GNAT family N-acetyltransferase n=1 Tax=Scytonema sp. NUACC26 TaxID=3140176 RepID=UPI0034DCB250
MSEIGYLPPGYSLRSSTSKDTFGIIQICFIDYKVLGLFWCCLLLLSYLFLDIPIKSLILELCLGFLGILAIVHLYQMSIIKSSQSWVIEYDRKIVACAMVQHFQNYSELYRLHIKYIHQKKGLGTCLVKTLLKEVNKPVYVVPFPKALYFYTRLGFVPIPRHRLPKLYSQLSRKGLTAVPTNLGRSRHS